MAMELRHLRYIIAVAEEGHITRAAERLGIQQPPLSRQIKAIEREIDVQLFRRKPRGVELTDAGRAFLDGARAMFASLDHTVETTRRTARGEQGQVSIGMSGAAFHSLVPRIIREFREAYPRVSVMLNEGFPDELIGRVRDEEIDIAFVRTPVVDPKGVVIESLLKEPMVVAMPSGHTLAQRAKTADTALPLKALAGETFILYGRGHTIHTQQSNAVLAACHAAGFNPRVGHVASNNVSRLNLVAAGLGIAMVAASMRRMNIDGVTYRRLKGTPLTLPLDVASRRGDPSAVVRQFLRLAKRTAKSFHEVGNVP
jgi:DNA-binding transcriptional LysR family regulator